MQQKIKKYNEEDIKKEFTIITDEEFRDIVENGYMPSYLYGSMYPEKEHIITYEN